MEYPLSKKEALAEMSLGKKVTHSTFTDNEWMTYLNGHLVTEDGCRHNCNDFWKYRHMEIFNNNYALFKANKPQKITNEKTEREAKHIVNKIYQPLGYLDCNVNNGVMWEYSKERAVEITEHFILKMPEGSSNWLHHRKLVDAIKNL